MRGAKTQTNVGPTQGRNQIPNRGNSHLTNEGQLKSPPGYSVQGQVSMMMPSRQFMSSHPAPMGIPQRPMRANGRPVYSSSPQGPPMHYNVPQQQNMTYPAMVPQEQYKPQMVRQFIPNKSPYQMSPYQQPYVPQQAQSYYQSVPVMNQMDYVQAQAQGQPQQQQQQQQQQPAPLSVGNSSPVLSNVNKPVSKPKRFSKITIRDSKANKDVTEEILSIASSPAAVSNGKFFATSSSQTDSSIQATFARQIAAAAVGDNKNHQDRKAEPDKNKVEQIMKSPPASQQGLVKTEESVVKLEKTVEKKQTDVTKTLSQQAEGVQQGNRAVNILAGVSDLPDPNAGELDQAESISIDKRTKILSSDIAGILSNKTLTIGESYSNIESEPRFKLLNADRKVVGVPSVKHQEQPPLLREQQQSQQQPQPAQQQSREQLPAKTGDLCFLPCNNLVRKKKSTKQRLKEMIKKESEGNFMDACMDKPPPELVVEEKVKIPEVVAKKIEKASDEDLCWDDEGEKIGDEISVEKGSEPEAVPLPAEQTRLKYERDFLLQFQFMPVCTKKPSGLPNLEVVLDAPAPQNKIGSQRGADFLPSYARQKAQGWGRLGDILGKTQPRKIIAPVNQPPVELMKSENCLLRPHEKGQELTDEEKKTANELYRIVVSMLNKLSPQKFKTLVEQIRQLDVDAPERLEDVIDRIYEKLHSEQRRLLPTYHEATGVDDLEREESRHYSQAEHTREPERRNGYSAKLANRRSYQDKQEDVWLPTDNHHEVGGTRVRDIREPGGTRVSGSEEPGAYYDNVAETLDPTYRRISRRATVPSDKQHDRQIGGKSAPTVPPLKQKAGKEKGNRDKDKDCKQQ